MRLTHSRAAQLGVLLLLTSTGAPGATLQATERLQAQAETAAAALLSPQHYLRGVAALDRARASENADKRDKALAEAAREFNTALANAELASETLGDVLAARTAANEADAFRLAARLWARGEEELNDAAREVEKGDLEDAIRRGARAREAYESAELAAIKTRYLNSARGAILEAERVDAERLAPRSLDRARELLASANAALDRDRYQTDEPAALAAEARYQARLASYIAGQAERVRDRDLSIEDLILDWQGPLRRLAEQAGTTGDLADGHAAAEAALGEELARVAELEKQVADRDRQLAGLEDELRELDERLGGLTAERQQLVRELEADARVREQFSVVENLFSPEEATVLRDGDTVIVRLLGLTFSSNSARLDEPGKALLDRLETAIEVFPRSDIRVEGHTDSSGDPRANQALSQERAESVARYLIESRGIQAFRVEAAGYGDRRPIASNRTLEGRSQNRRIDVVIVPATDG